MEQIDTIIWDWNGTLLNDTDICIESINGLLADRHLPQLNREEYLNTFGFPVIDYYRRIGFDFSTEPFDIPANQYINCYTQKVKDCQLHEAALPVLTFFKSRGFKQVVLSASETGILETSIAHFNIGHFFEALSGLGNHYANSKTEIGIGLMKTDHIQPQKACLIGDTAHDFDVAQKLGCNCVLVANGHQHASKLIGTGAFVVEKLTDIMALFGEGEPTAF
jgi:phosphoglycolate phosphatase